MYKILTLCVLTTLTTACGFHLKGLQVYNTQPPTNYSTLDIEFTHQGKEELYAPLARQLKNIGILVQSQENTPVLNILDYQFRRQQLNGKLTEVLLHLNVTFRIEDSTGKALTQERKVRSYRNYQYNIATVNTDNQQESYLRQKMLDDVAQQISLQLSHQRLPQH